MDALQETASCRKLFEKQLGREEVEQELALAVRQVGPLEQRFDLVAADDVEYRAVGQHLAPHRRVAYVEEVEDRRVEADLAPVVEQRLRGEAAHRVAQHRLCAA